MDLVRALLDRLAVSQAVLQGIDDTLDIFADLDRGKSIAITGMIDKARLVVMRDCNYQISAASGRQIRDWQFAGEKYSIRDSQAYAVYHELLKEYANAFYRGSLDGR